jgi:hypothetical protein
MSATVTVLPLTTNHRSPQRLYRCYILAESGHIQRLETLSCSNDDHAQSLAELIFLRQADCAAVELWDIGRIMLRLSRDSAPRQRVLAPAA